MEDEDWSVVSVKVMRLMQRMVIQFFAIKYVSSSPRYFVRITVLFYTLYLS